MKRSLFMLLVLVVLAGCVRPTAFPSTPKPGPTTVNRPTAVRSLIPASTGYPARSQEPTETAPAAPGYPAPQNANPKAAVPGMAAPSATERPTTQSAQLQSSNRQIAPFQDCARTPGLAGCADPASTATSVIAAARLAFYDASANRLLAVDLQTGQGWQTAMHPKSLSWSPKGDQLLAAQGVESNQRYALFQADGQALALPPVDSNLRWQPDDTLSADTTVRSEEGAEARLEYSQASRWILHVKSKADAAEQTLDITPEPGDQVYQLRDWIPGTSKLLVQRFFASNAAMLVGGKLVVIDTSSGAVQELQLTAPLSDPSAFAWNPQQKNLLALIATGGDREGARRLALLDLQSGQLRYPLPDGVGVSDLAWSPDGQQLAFSAQPQVNLPPETQKIFPGAGIYQMALQKNALQNLVTSPTGMLDGWPHWTSDGSVLVYAHALVDKSGEGRMQVRARVMQSGQDVVLVEGLTAPREVMGQVIWSDVLAFGKK